MLNIPGRAGSTCEGPTRRELMRIGSLGLAGLHLLASFFRRTALANDAARNMQAHAVSATPRASS